MRDHDLGRSADDRALDARCIEDVGDHSLGPLVAQALGALLGTGQRRHLVTGGEQLRNQGRPTTPLAPARKTRTS